MNTKDYKVRTSPVVLPDEYISDKKGNNHELDIDSFSTQPALLNCYGWPTNDIMLYEQSQSDSVARAVLQRVPISKIEGLEPGSYDIEQQFNEMCPANWDSPAEFVRYSRSVAESAYKRAAKLRESKKQKESTISFDDKVEEQTKS